MMTTPALLTAGDLLTDSCYERGELWDGHFVVAEPSGGPHGVIEALGISILMHIERLRAAGRVLGSSTGYVVARDPDRVLSPDIAWISRDRLPAVPTTGFVEGAPELAIEIRSPRDSWASCLAKGGVWIGHGARVVWCVNPPERTIVVLRPGDDAREFGQDDAAPLTPVAEETIPVADLFQGI